MRVLIADDEREVGRSLADLVRFCNHQVVGVAASGLEAIQAYNRFHPDLVLMDYRMPKLNGATACRNILSKDPAARIILVSGWSPSDEASQSGAISMLAKPVSLEKLQAALQSVAETLPELSPAEMPIPEVYFQPEPIEYPITYSPSVDQPIVNFEFPAPDFPPLPIEPPSLEIRFPVEAPQPQPEQSGEVCALAEENIPVKRRRRAQRPRVR
jgi:CheY-like chemotaxis protein